MNSNRDSAAFWVTAPNRGEIRHGKLPELPAGQVQVRTLYSAISRGTESVVFRAEVPRSAYKSMRCPFQEGDFPHPVKYGYINVGVVEEGPEPLQGRTVFCLYPHQTRYQVAAEWVHPLPDGVSARRAVLAANMETAINGLWDAAPRLGDRIAVIGAGTLGCLVAMLATRIPGCSVELIDINSDRAEVAASLGAEFRTPENATPDADLLVHTSASAAGLRSALELAGFEARILEMSWYGDRAVPLPLGEAFHSRRIRILSSQVGVVAAAQRPRWDTKRRMTLALSLLRDPALDLLVTGEDRFEDLPQIQARLAAAPEDTICHRIRYP